MNTPLLDGIRKQAGWGTAAASFFRGGQKNWGKPLMGAMKSFSSGGGVTKGDLFGSVGGAVGQVLSKPAGQRMSSIAPALMNPAISLGAKAIGGQAGRMARAATGSNQAPTRRLPPGGMASRYR